MNKINFDSIILQAISKVLVFFINTFALYLMLQGHNSPGGGFIAGLVSALSLVLLNMALGLDETKKIIRIDPVLIAVIGLILAYGTSLAPTFFDLAFLKSKFVHWYNLPLLGDLHIGTPFFFDLGVYLVVIGVTSKIILTYSYLVNHKEEYFLEETFRYSSKNEEIINEEDDD